MDRDQCSKLEHDIVSIDKRVAAYEQEKVQVTSSSGQQNADGERLQQNLITLLDVQINKLNMMREAKQRRLQAVEGAEDSFKGDEEVIEIVCNKG